MTTAIISIGTVNPPFKRDQMETAELIISALNLKPSEKRLLKTIYKHSGIKTRHSILKDYCKLPGQFEFFPNDPDASYPTTSARMKLYKENALPLALSAIESCIKPINFNKNKITHVITVSCTGMYAPGLDIEIVQTLNLNTHTQRTAINFMGCYGAFNAIKMANAICKAEPDSSVLVVCVELCTLHFQKVMSTENIISNAIFSDGAAAVLIQSHYEQKKYLKLESFHCDLLPQTSDAMAWHISDSGFDIVLSSYVPDMIQSGINNFIKKLNHQSLPIDFYAIHPGGLKILQACEEALDITPDDNRFSYSVLENYGNMSSATILFVLKNIWDSLGTNDQDKTIFACAFGPGLTLESMLLKINQTLDIALN